MGGLIGSSSADAIRDADFVDVHPESVDAGTFLRIGAVAGEGKWARPSGHSSPRPPAEAGARVRAGNRETLRPSWKIGVSPYVSAATGIFSGPTSGPARASASPPGEGRQLFHGSGIPKHVGDSDAANAGGRPLAK